MYGPRCETLHFVKCFVNITEPAVYDTSPCRNSQTGSETVEGFESCFFFDFSQSYKFKFKLQCKSISSKGLVEVNPSSLGQEYRDVISPVPTFESLNKQKPRISNKKLTITIDFRDWKYLSNIERF